MNSSPADDAIALHYQPWLDGRGRAEGLEAVMRWHHRGRGANSPEAFIPIFPQSGLIPSLSRWTLLQACTDAVCWRKPLTVAVKLLPVQFAEPGLPELVGLCLGLAGLPAERLELEMTGATWLTDPERTHATLAALEAMGVQIALDDFGTAESAPENLPDFPFSKLKIDPSFIAGIDHSESARWIVSTLIEFGHSLDFTVSAEGVETPSQHAFLMEQGCDLMQGCLLGHPAPIETFAPLTGCRPAIAPSELPVADIPFAASRWFTEDARLRVLA